MRTSLWDESEQKRNARVTARQPEWLLAADGHFLLGENGGGYAWGGLRNRAGPATRRAEAAEELRGGVIRRTKPPCALDLLYSGEILGRYETTGES